MKKIMFVLPLILSTISYSMDERSWEPFEPLVLASASSEREPHEDFFSGYPVNDFLFNEVATAIPSEPAQEPPTIPAAATAPLIASIKMLNQESESDHKDGIHASRVLLKTKTKKKYKHLSGKYKCDICKKILKYPWGLISHKNRMHEKPDRWPCYFAKETECKTTFISNSDYTRHLNVKHRLTKQEIGKIRIPKKRSYTVEGGSAKNPSISTVDHRPLTRATTGALTLKALIE